MMIIHENIRFTYIYMYILSVLANRKELILSEWVYSMMWKRMIMVIYYKCYVRIMIMLLSYLIM